MPLDRNKYIFARDSVIKLFKKKFGYKAPLNKMINKFMIQYFDYATEAVINGYPVVIISSRKINAGIRFQLIYEPVRELTEQEQRIYLKSDKVVEYIFKIEFINHVINNRMVWYPDSKLRERLQEVLNSDNVYQLVKQ